MCSTTPGLYKRRPERPGHWRLGLGNGCEDPLAADNSPHPLQYPLPTRVAAGHSYVLGLRLIALLLLHVLPPFSAEPATRPCAARLFVLLHAQ